MTEVIVLSDKNKFFILNKLPGLLSAIAFEKQQSYSKVKKIPVRYSLTASLSGYTRSG